MWPFQAQFKRQMPKTDLSLPSSLFNGPKKEGFQGKMKGNSVMCFQGKSITHCSFSFRLNKVMSFASSCRPCRPDSLEFGAGSHACPGRFFATNALKVALIRILDRYDFRRPTGTRRPPAIYNHLFEMVQDRNAGLEFSVRES